MDPELAGLPTAEVAKVTEPTDRSGNPIQWSPALLDEVDKLRYGGATQSVIPVQ